MAGIKYSKTTKELMQKQLEKLIKTNPNFVISNHSGVATNDLNVYRKEVRKGGAKYFVVRNRLCKRVFKTARFDELEKHATGSCGITFLGKDPVESTKAVIEFSKKFQAFAVRAGVIDGAVMDAVKLKQLAALPSKQVLLSQLLSVLQSPMTGFVGVLGGVTRKFVYVISSIKEKRSKE